MQARNLAQMRFELRPKLRQPSRSAKGLIHPIAEHDDIRRPLRQQRLQVLDIALSPQAVADFIARPREAAHAEVFVRMRELQIRLQRAGFEQPLDHRVAVE